MKPAPKPTTTTVRWAWSQRRSDGAGEWLIDWEWTKVEATSMVNLRKAQGYDCGPVTKIEIPLPRVTK